MSFKLIKYAAPARITTAAASAIIAVAQNALEDAPFDFMSKIPKG